VIDVGAPSALLQAMFVVGAVFFQAIALYVGYGAAERVVTPLIETITGA
jgi:hypothetical protein